MINLEKFCRHLRIPREVEREVDNMDNIEVSAMYAGIKIKYKTKEGSKEARAECIYLTGKINEGMPTACQRRLKTMSYCPLAEVEYPILVPRR